MTDSIEEIGSQETVESKGTPTPDFSAASEGKTSDGKAVDVEARLGDFKRELLEEVERRSQSVKDKRLSKMQESIDRLSKAKELLDAHGGNVQKAARESVLLETAETLMGEPQAQKPSPQVLPGREQLAAEYDAEITDYLTERGFKPEEIAEATAGMANEKFEATPKGLKRAIAKAAAMADTWRENKGKQDAPASVGAMALPKGGAVSRDLTEKYIQEFSAARGKPAEAKAIREKYMKLGVDVYNIGWGAKGTRGQGEK